MTLLHENYVSGAMLTQGLGRPAHEGIIFNTNTITGYPYKTTIKVRRKFDGKGGGSQYAKPEVVPFQPYHLNVGHSYVRVVVENTETGTTVVDKDYWIDESIERPLVEASNQQERITVLADAVETGFALPIVECDDTIINENSEINNNKGE